MNLKLALFREEMKALLDEYDVALSIDTASNGVEVLIAEDRQTRAEYAIGPMSGKLSAEGVYQ